MDNFTIFDAQGRPAQQLCPICGAWIVLTDVDCGEGVCWEWHAACACGYTLDFVSGATREVVMGHPLVYTALSEHQMAIRDALVSLAQRLREVN